jgi:hypothetical protein
LCLRMLSDKVKHIFLIFLQWKKFVLYHRLLYIWISTVQGTAGKTFWGHVPKLSIHFEENLSHRNFEEKNKVLEPSIIIIN